VLSVSIEADNHRLRWLLAGSVNATGATGAQFQAAGDDGDYHDPVAVVSASATELVLQYADFFDPGNAAWFVGSSPPGVLTPGTTFEVPEAGFF
jgi:hypothetical protein